METHMERDEPLINEFREKEDPVTVRVTRRDAADGRSWLNFRVGRCYFTKDKKEGFTVDLGASDLPMAIWALLRAYLWVKSTPQAGKKDE
jgi:hypothetical protein